MQRRHVGIVTGGTFNDGLTVRLDPTTGDTVTTTMTDTLTGEYVLQALLAGTYDVRAEAAGYDDSLKTGITVTAGSDTPDVDFELVSSGG